MSTNNVATTYFDVQNHETTKNMFYRILISKKSAQ